MPKIGIKFIEGGRIFAIDAKEEYSVDQIVVVETIRGLELATVSALGQKVDCGSEEVKTIVRVATNKDIEMANSLKGQEDSVKQLTNDLIAKYKLDMKIVSVSHTLDGSKVVINYVCEDRVDFRELVKELASALRIRIELRQIGIRDQAKIIGGIGFCGKECCCKKYLNDFDKVSIKMAKSQGLSLNPTKISGICGRLMCCLAYENDFYSEISAKMPKIGGRVKTKDGVGTVVYNNLLKQTITVKIESAGEIKVTEYDLGGIEILPKVSVESTKKQKENKIDNGSPIDKGENNKSSALESQGGETPHGEGQHKKKKKKYNNFHKKR